MAAAVVFQRVGETTHHAPATTTHLLACRIIFCFARRVQVTLGVPWLEREDQDKVYPTGKRYETIEDQVCNGFLYRYPTAVLPRGSASRCTRIS